MVSVFVRAPLTRIASASNRSSMSKVVRIQLYLSCILMQMWERRVRSRSTIGSGGAMRSAVAEEARAAQRAREARMTPTARVRLALALGARDLRVFAAARGVSIAQAWKALRDAKQVGRTPSAVMERLGSDEASEPSAAREG
jgi:hypothetical protein